MGRENVAGLDELFQLFDEKVTLADINASKYLGKISAAIVQRRIDLKMTQKEFAEYVDVSQSMVSKWESSDYNFTVKGLAELAEKLNMELYINFKNYRESSGLVREGDFSYWSSGNSKFVSKSSNIVSFKTNRTKNDWNANVNSPLVYMTQKEEM